MYLRDADVSAVPAIDPEAVDALKFSQALPRSLAARTLGERLADPVGAQQITQAVVLRFVAGDLA